MLSVVALALGAAGLMSWLGGRLLSDDPLELAPAGTTAVFRIDVPALMASPLWAAWVGEGDAGYRRIVTECGFDPLADLRTADIYLVGTTRRPLDQVGFVVRGPLRHEELIRCVERVSEDDGGGVHEVEIEGVRAIASDHGASRAAFVGSDAIVGGDEDLVRELLRRAHGEGESLANDEVLAALYQRVQSRRELIAVARVPESWRRVLLQAAPDAGWAPLGTMEAVALGARIREGLGATVVLELSEADDARDLRGAINDWITATLARPLVRMSLIGAALAHVEVAVDRRELVLTAELDEDELGAVVAYFRGALEGALHGEAPTEPEPPPAMVPPVPDEVIEAVE
jgi:hypothetical protein